MTALEPPPQPATSSLRVRPGGKLSDFHLGVRLLPLVSFLFVSLALYAWTGLGVGLLTFVKLCSAYAVAFLALSLLATVKGDDASWLHTIPVALAGIALGGLAASAIAAAPGWRMLFNTTIAFSEWATGAAFSAFFVGLSLVAATVRQRELAIADAREQLLEARLETLTAQIEPHFLMNTLANLRYLIKTDSRSAHDMLDHLADFLQGALDRSRDSSATLGDELQVVESYLGIMQIRLGDRLRYAIDVPEEVRKIPFPPLLLQTLAENAITHGIQPGTDTGLLQISAQRAGPQIILTISDDGVGIDRAASSGQGLGLKNATQRLESYYRGRASLTVAPGPVKGTTATVSIPASAP